MTWRRDDILIFAHVKRHGLLMCSLMHNTIYKLSEKIHPLLCRRFFCAWRAAGDIGGTGSSSIWSYTGTVTFGLLINDQNAQIPAAMIYLNNYSDISRALNNQRGFLICHEE